MFVATVGIGAALLPLCEKGRFRRGLGGGGTGSNRLCGGVVKRVKVGYCVVALVGTTCFKTPQYPRERPIGNQTLARQSHFSKRKTAQNSEGPLWRTKGVHMVIYHRRAEIRPRRRKLYHNWGSRNEFT